MHLAAIYDYLCQSCRDDENDDGALKWSVGPVITSCDKQPPPHQLPLFSYPEGPSPRTKSAKTPLQVLQLFLTSIILDSIVQQTKLFAQQKGKDFEFCVEELMAFIGITIAMGMLRLPRVKDLVNKQCSFDSMVEVNYVQG